jgi:hypothetical protein
MKTYLSNFGLILVLLLVAGIGSATAQKATEIYIPVGKSPGLTGEYITLGTVTDVNSATRQLLLIDSSGQTRSVQITDSTRIYIDRSPAKKTNLYGSFTDCQVGLPAEVKFYAAKVSAYPEAAEWIKIQMQE